MPPAKKTRQRVDPDELAIEQWLADIRALGHWQDDSEQVDTESIGRLLALANRYPEHPAIKKLKLLFSDEKSRTIITRVPRKEQTTSSDDINLARELICALPASDLRQLVQTLPKSKQQVLHDAAVTHASSESQSAATIDGINRLRNEQLATATKAEVFGDAEPSSAGFRAYLKRLRQQTDTTYEQKKVICRVVNFWKNELGLNFYYEGRACSLSPRTSGSKRGGYTLRASDSSRKYLYTKAPFPPFSVRKSRS